MNRVKRSEVTTAKTGNIVSIDVLSESLSLLFILFGNRVIELVIFLELIHDRLVLKTSNLVERISILSQNENKSNIGRLLQEILNKNNSEREVSDNQTVAMSFPLKQARENFEKSYLLNQLRRNKGNISKTAEFIGMERSALHRKLKSLGIKGIN